MLLDVKEIICGYENTIIVDGCNFSVKKGDIAISPFLTEKLHPSTIIVFSYPQIISFTSSSISNFSLDIYL